MCAIVIIFTVLTLHVGTSLASPQINTKLFRTPPVVGAPIYTKLFHTPPVVGVTISKPNADLEDHVAPTNATGNLIHTIIQLYVIFQDSNARF